MRRHPRRNPAAPEILRLRPVHFAALAGIAVAGLNERRDFSFVIKAQPAARRERTIKRRHPDGGGVMIDLVQHRESADARVRRNAFTQQAVGKNNQRGDERNRRNRPQHPRAAVAAVEQDDVHRADDDDKRQHDDHDAAHGNFQAVHHGKRAVRRASIARQ